MWVFNLNNAKYVELDEVRKAKFSHQQHNTVKSVYLHASITVNNCL